MSTNELIQRRAAMMQSRSGGTDWESVARGMIDQTTEFDVPDGILQASQTNRYYVFYARVGLKSCTIPAGATQLGSSFFFGCTSLKSITIPDTIVQIQASAFQGCSSLVDVTLGSGLTTLARSVFQGCTAIESITIPASVTDVGVNFMRQCTSLAEVIMMPTTPPTLGENGFLQSPNLQAIYVPDASVSAYQAASGWSTHASIIKGISQRPT